MVRLIESTEKLTGKAEKEFADSVLEVSIGANVQVIEELMGDGRMCQALLEIMEPHLQRREKEGLEEGIKEGREREAASIALRLIALGMDDATIIGATSLSTEKVKSLRKKP